MAASSEMTIISSEKRSLVHPFHEHALTLRDLPKDCKAVCLLCKHYSQGPTYCCEDCDFILHEACAQIELPPLIQGHPSHRPDHPLNLVPGERSYCCSGCGFSLGALTAIATRPPAQDIEEETILHFRHEEHPLSSFCVETALQVQCGLCQEQICAGQVYGCRSCPFLLHEACARLTLEIQHSLHPRHPLTFLAVCTKKCKVCISHMMSEEPGYSCEECRFSLHVRCAVLTMDARNHPRKDAEEGPSSSAIDHISHRHPLTSLHVEELVQSFSPKERLCMECKICRLDISGADAVACGDCSFFIHKSCADMLPDEIRHPLHPLHPCLTLQLKDSFLCKSCQKYTPNIAFSCKDCDFNLEPVCAFQTLSAIEDGAAVKISHFAHKHPLMLVFTKYRRNSSDRCIACHEFINGIAYRCITCIGVWLHRSCAEQPLELEHAFHPQHPLTLSEAPTKDFFCFACGESPGGLAFHCAECEFYLGLTCASLNQTLKHPCHEHSLGYYESINKTNHLQCNCCGKRCRYDCYCCLRCRFSLHRDCLHLPPSIKHKSHWHPLQLRDKFVDKDPNDLYCDYCETIRDPDHGVYHCEECKFSAHIKCIISDSKEDERGSETWGSDLCNQLNIEIASRKAKIEIMRRDIEVLGANLELSVEELADIENKEEDDDDGEEEDSEDEDSEDKDSDEDEESEDYDEEENNEEEEDSEEEDSNEEDYEGYYDNEDGYYEEEDEDEDGENEDKEDEEHGLKHPCHRHKLILRILSKNCQVECSLCKLEIHGPAYCCKSCDYFLHGSCALIELPPKIQHPSHPPHPLTLSGKIYKCSKCSKPRVQVLTAIATLPSQDDKWLEEDDAEEDEHNNEKDGEEHNKEQLEETGIIWHFAHKEHPLASFHIEIQLSTKCKGCRKRISGQVYGCRTCLFLLHASCAQSPQMIDHHPFGSGFSLAPPNGNSGDADVRDKCRACAENIERGFVYSRPDDLGGWLRFHMACVLSTRFLPSHQDRNSADFKVHPCSLFLFHIEEETYAPIQCRVCELKISGEARGCPKCGFILHKSCSEKLLEVEMIHHFLHPDHRNLVLQVRGDSMSSYLDYRCRCTTCQMASRGLHPNPCMAFQCDSCEFYLNPNCALQTLSAVEEGAAASILHFAHDHPLLLHFIREEVSIDCIACEDVIAGLAYYCVNGDTCNSIALHKSCAELPQELEHLFHSQHRLVLLSKTSAGYFHCSACREKSTGFAYYCAECEFYLDMRCAALNPTLKHPRHEHKLAYFKESIRFNALCDACRERCEKDLYHCALCNFNLHYDCLPLPPEITHEGHRLHPLFLRDKFVDGDPNYQYCDHCEKLRHPDEGVYHCELCWFSAHIDCMISKDEEDAEEEATEEESNATDVDPNEEESPVAGQANSKARLKAMIDGSRRNIDTMKGILDTLIKEQEELEIERKSL